MGGGGCWPGRQPFECDRAGWQCQLGQGITFSGAAQDGTMQPCPGPCPLQANIHATPTTHAVLPCHQAYLRIHCVNLSRGVLIPQLHHQVVDGLPEGWAGWTRQQRKSGGKAHNKQRVGLGFRAAALAAQGRRKNQARMLGAHVTADASHRIDRTGQGAAAQPRGPTFCPMAFLEKKPSGRTSPKVRVLASE